MPVSVARLRNTLAFGFFATLFLIHQSLYAQGYGSIRGQILDSETGDPLPFANVMVENTAIGTSTDPDGRFTLRNVPAGQQMIKASYIGYVSVSRAVTVTEEATTEQNFRLTAQAITGETIVVTAQAQGQNAAINQQLASNTIANVVSKARIQELPDVNAAESVGRLPGVSINRSGGEASSVAIRGLSAKYNLVTVNGVRLPASGDDRGTSLQTSVGDPDSRWGGNDRSADLSLISSNSLDGIELKKAITPDMDADVLGGTIDLKLKEAPEGLQIYTSAQGGYNKLQDYYGNYSFLGSVSNRFFDGVLGVIANVNVDDYDRSADKLSGDYMQQGLSDIIIRSLDLREEKVKRGRTGANLLLDYRLENGKISSNLFYNRVKWEGIYRLNRMNTNDKRHYYDLEDRGGTTDLFTGSLNITQNYDWIRLDAGIARIGSWGRNPNERTWRFSQETGTVFTIQPTVDTDVKVIPDSAKIDTNTTKFADGYVFDTKRDERQTVAQMNVELPFHLGEFLRGYLKTGVKLRWLDRRNDEETWGVNNLQYGGGINELTAMVRLLSIMYPDEWDFQRDSARLRSDGGMLIRRFLYDYSRPGFLDGEYPLGLAIDPDKANRFADAMVNTPSVYQRYSVPSMGRDYDGVERYQAAYLMAELSLGEYIDLLPGIRYERDYSLYHGQSYRAVTIGGSKQGAPQELTPLTTVRDHDFWLPMVHLTLKPMDWLKVRLAYTSTLTRPDYRQYAPITYITSQQDQIVAANSSLRPAKSRNYDAAVSVFNNSIGLFTVSAFYKRITDLIFSSRYNTAPGVPAPPGSNIPESWLASANPPIYSYSMNNPEPAKISGFELEWQTHFWYLPWVLKGLVLNVNYTRIYSDVETHFFVTDRIQIRPAPPVFRYVIRDSTRTSRVLDQPAHLANVTLGYDYEGFSARLSYLYQTDRVSGISTNPGLDSFTGSYSRWDLSIQQTLDWGLQIFANFANIGAVPDRSFRGYKLINPTYLEYYGFTMDLGVRWRL